MAHMTVTTTDGRTYSSKEITGDELKSLLDPGPQGFQAVLKEILGGADWRNLYMVDHRDVFRRFNPDNITNIGFVGLTDKQRAALD